LNNNLSTEREIELVRQLQAGIDVRVQGEIELQSKYANQIDEEQKDFQRSEQAVREHYDLEMQALQNDYENSKSKVLLQFEPEYRTKDQEFRSRKSEADAIYEQGTESAKATCEETCWMVQSYFDESANDSPKQQYDSSLVRYENSRQQMGSEIAELDDVLKNAVEILSHRGQWREYDPPEQNKLADNQERLFELFSDYSESAHGSFKKLEKQLFPRFVAGWRTFVILLVSSLIFSSAIFAIQFIPGFTLPIQHDKWMLISPIGGGFLGLMVLLILLGIAKRQSENVYDDLQQAVSDSHRAFQTWNHLWKKELADQQERCDRWFEAIVAKRDKAVAGAEEKKFIALKKLTEDHDSCLKNLNDTFPVLLDRLIDQKEKALQKSEKKFNQHKTGRERQFQSDIQSLSTEHDRRIAEFQQAEQHDRQSLAENWTAVLQTFELGSRELNEACAQHFPDWATLQEHKTGAETIPPALPIGHFNLDLESMPDGFSEDESLIPETTQFQLPAVLPFPNHPSLFIKTHGSGREAAVDVMQAAMLRLLTSLPPGKLRFTILDPVGLGENFSAFMHLADHDELLVNSRIWTSPSHIERRLADMTEHMENVFQTYLRNEFQTIDEYNDYAGEVAEPYHVVVVANFPNNFSETAAQRLISIANSGPRCGVFTIISADTKQTLPHNVRLADFEENSTVLNWKSGRLVSADPELQNWDLEIEPLPEPAVFSNLVQQAGELAKNARQVEVPFSRIAPGKKDVWVKDSRSGIDIPLGRAGATKLQHLRLGRGTAQHVVIAGKTGSGKSSFLHALITNCALHYSPNEIEFYLVDFKKGVEFKTYATNALPHARVIAIESDREFGLSVLEKLDAVLKQRGDLYRQQGVQDIATFRKEQPEVRMPRILLIVDEFQEFFVEDDRISQDASLLLDRLVRQGRAFGIHVLLGSQTLGGAYSLARTTLGQMAVRIALQCSETDAHLILSEENTAARLLTRPGEAIYNDANGLVEGNHPFQIAWLPDDQRDEHLSHLKAEAQSRNIQTPPTMVFEGNIPADPARNNELAEQFSTFSSIPTADQPPEFSPVLWLGDAVSIAAPPRLTLDRQSGSHLIIVGQNSELALGMMTTTLLSLAAQTPCESSEANSEISQFFIFDGSPTAGPEANIWKQACESLPHETRLVTPNETQTALAQLSGELNRRTENPSEPSPPIYVFIYNLGRFRDLRKDDDDYGFSGFDTNKPATTSQQFTNLIKTGPSHGVHVFIWSDTFNNVNRWLSNQTLRELEYRIAFQMSGADSSNFIDSPIASRLGINRALLYRDNTGTLEKFRPYGSPSEEWLTWAAQQLGTAVEPKEPNLDEYDETDLDLWTVT